MSSSSDPDPEQIAKIVKEEGDDNRQFTNLKSRYECVIHRNDNTGAWCGYVILPKSNPFYDLDHLNKDLSMINVHGGLTYSNADGVFGFDCSHYGDYYPKSLPSMFANFITDIADAHERVVDKAFQEKPRVYRTIEYVINETNSMAEQFFKYDKQK